MRNRKAAGAVILLCLLLLAGAVHRDRKARAERERLRIQADIASEIAAMHDTSQWPPELVGPFTASSGSAFFYDMVVREAKASPASYRAWYDQGNHRDVFPTDRRLEPRQAREYLRALSAYWRTGNLEGAGFLLEEIDGELTTVPFRPREPQR